MDGVTRYMALRSNADPYLIGYGIELMSLDSLELRTKPLQELDKSSLYTSPYPYYPKV